MDWYAPATGNWCWIKQKPVYLRYVLTHGWRYLFIITEICLYVYLYIWIRRHYKKMRASLHAVDIYPSGSSATQDTTSHEIKSGRGPYQHQGASSSGYNQTVDMKGSSLTVNSTPQWSLSHMIGFRQNRPSNSWTENPQYQAIQKMLLLNSYPLAYIILWIPGITNRLIEATGHKSNVMTLMQASTQLVGLANALTYGWNEKVSTQVREYFRSKKTDNRS